MLAALARTSLVQPASPGRYALHDLLRADARDLAAGYDGGAGGAGGAHPPARLLPGRRRQRHGRPRPGRTALPAAPRADRHAGPAAGDRRPGRAAGSTPNAPSWSRSPLHAAAHGWPGHATRLAATLYRYLETGGHYADAVTIHGHAQPRRPRCSATAPPRRWRSPTSASSAGGRAATSRRPTTISRRWPRRSRSATAGARPPRWPTSAPSTSGGAATSRPRTATSRPWPPIQSVGERTGEARALGNLGSVAAREGQYEQAVDWYQQALAVFRETGDRTGEASALPDLGRAYQRQGRYEEAVGCYQRALALFRETGDRTGEAEARNGVAEILLATGRPDEARVAYTAALALAGQLGEAYEQARAHHGLAAALHAVGDDGLARHHRSCALELYSALGAPEADAIRAELDQPSLTGQEELAGA